MSSGSIAIPVMLMGGAVLWLSLYFWREGRDLRAEGVEAHATILKKYKKSGDSYFLGLENCFVNAQFTDGQGIQRTVEIRVPSRQWHWLREGAEETILYLPTNPQRARVISRAGNIIVSGILFFTTMVGATMILFGLFFMVVGLKPGSTTSVALSAKDPPPTKFDKSGVAHVEMMISPQHDRIAILEDGKNLRVRGLSSGNLVASTSGHGWRLLGWNPAGTRLAVAEGPGPLVLDAASLTPVAGETYSWNREAPALAACAGAPAVWDSSGTQAAAACGKQIMVSDSSAVRLLAGHTEKVLGLAWSPSGSHLASVSEDNYVRVWDPRDQRCVAVSEDYPYPRAVYFADEKTVVVIDVALRRYDFRLPF